MCGEEDSEFVPVTDDIGELDSSLVEAAAAHVPQSRSDHKSLKVASGVQINNHGETEGLEQVSGAPATKGDGLGKSLPRPGTSIRTLLSPAPSVLSHNENSGSTTFSGKDNDQASPRTLADVKISYNRSPGASDAPPGKLVSAREQVQFLLRGSGRRRVHKSRSLFPPSP